MELNDPKVCQVVNYEVNGSYEKNMSQKIQESNMRLNI